MARTLVMVEMLVMVEVLVMVEMVRTLVTRELVTVVMVETPECGPS